MGQAIPGQHPTVILRSRHARPRYLLAAAMIGVVGLSGAAVIAANDDRDEVSGTTATKSIESPNPVGSPRYFEGVAQSTPGKGTRGSVSP